MGTRYKNSVMLLVMLMFAITADVSVEAKHKYGSGKSSRPSSSSFSSRLRRISHNKPSSDSSSSYSRHSSPSHSSRPSFSHSDSGSLGYSGYNKKANKRPSSNSRPASGSNTKHTVVSPTSRPIGWNEPPKQGPQPTYSPSAKIGGAKTNIHEPTPAATNPDNRPVQATNYNNQHSSDNRFNSTGGGGFVSNHTPTTATNAHNVQSSYPAEARFQQQPQKTSFEEGFGHALKSSITKIKERVVGNVGGSSNKGGGGGGGRNSDDSNRIVIINNGPPGSVKISDVGGGTTVINTRSAQAPTAAQAPLPQQPAQLAPFNSPIMDNTNTAYAAPNNPAHPLNTTASAVPNSAAANQPPTPGGIICVPIKVPQPDPKDPTKTIEVEQIACYPAPPPEPVTPQPSAAAVVPTTATVAVDTTAVTAERVTTLEGGIALAPLQSTTPSVIPGGLYPWHH